MKLSSPCLFTLLFLSACGPIYETRDTFVPPADQRGKICINDCLKEKNKCANQCNKQLGPIDFADNLVSDTTYKNCILNRDRINNTRANCINQCKIGRDDETIINWCVNDCNRNNVSPSCSNKKSNRVAKCIDGCGDSYNMCYQNCGGKIITTKVCVAFCDKVKS